jgi:hypothetical protein
MSRTAKQIIILGFNGTSKTTLTRKFVERALKSNERVLVVTPDYAEWLELQETMLQKPADFDFTGARRYVWCDDPLAIQKIRDYFFNGLLVFDDCRSYLSGNTDIALKGLYLRRRQKMIDIVMCGHGFTDVPLQAFTNCSEFILFMTKDNIARRKSAIQDYDLVKDAQTRVNLRAKDKRKGWVDPKDIDQNIHYYEIVKP